MEERIEFLAQGNDEFEDFLEYAASQGSDLFAFTRAELLAEFEAQQGDD